MVPWCGPAIVAAPPVPPAQRLPVQPAPMPALAPWPCGQAARSEGRRARDHPARRLALRTLGRARNGPSKGAAGGGGVGGGPLAWTAVGGCKPGQLAQPSAMLLREAPVVSGLGRRRPGQGRQKHAGGGRVPSTMSRHAGHVCQPSVWSKARASAARCKLRAPPPPLPSKRAQVSANSGRRWRRTGSASAQPAQYAAGAVRVADSKPSPPSAAGSSATTRSWAASCGGTPPRSVANVFQTC